MRRIEGKRFIGYEPTFGLSAANVAFSVTSENTAQLSVGSGALTLTVTAPAEYAGSYPLTAEDVASGPVELVPPAVAGTPNVGQTMTARAALWAFDGSGMTPSRSWQWRRDGLDIPGATGMSYLLDPADAGALVAVLETAVDGNGLASSLSPSVSVSA